MSTPRLQEPSFLILSALADEPRHGYALLEQVSLLSGGAVTLKVGSLYGALDRLAAQGLLAVDREEVVESRLRRYYRLTPRGVEVLTQEAERLSRQAAAALQRLRAGQAPA